VGVAVTCDKCQQTVDSKTSEEEAHQVVSSLQEKPETQRAVFQELLRDSSIHVANPWIEVSDTLWKRPRYIRSQKPGGFGFLLMFTTPVASIRKSTGNKECTVTVATADGSLHEEKWNATGSMEEVFEEVDQKLRENGWVLL